MYCIKNVNRCVKLRCTLTEMQTVVSKRTLSEMSTRCVKLKYTLAKMQTDVSKDKACLIKNVNRCIVSSYSIPWLKFRQLCQRIPCQKC